MADEKEPQKKPEKKPIQNIAPEKKNPLGDSLDKLVTNISKGTRTPFIDGYNFLSENIPRQAEGWAGVLGGGTGAYVGGSLLYNALLPTLGLYAIPLTVIGGIASYITTSPLVKQGFVYATHPMKTIEKIYNGIKAILKFPFTPNKSTKKSIAYIEKTPENISGLYENWRKDIIHPFESANERIFPAKEKKEEKPSQYTAPQYA